MLRLSKPRVWGYLLPLDDGLPAFDLRLDESVVGTDQTSALRLDAVALGLMASAAPSVLFRVLRSDGKAILHSESAVVRVDGHAVGSNCDVPLMPGTHIVLGVAGATYTFVDRTISETFKAPQDVLEKYLVGNQLGQGSFGQVFLLFDKKSKNKRRAMKIVESSDEVKRKIAKREVEILKSLKHPCVVETYDVKEMDEHQFLVMEFLGGGDLRCFVNEKRILSEDQTKLLFFQLVLAVQYLHKENVCHRDLKPANILLKCREPRTLIKVTDFGLAKSEAMHSSLKSEAGTEAYRAPEIIMSDSSYTHLVDIWSMGVILYYSLTGSLPFPSSKEAMSRRYKVRYNSKDWRGVSEEARTLVQYMLREVDQQRPSATEVIESLWMQDDAMREDAHQLTGLDRIRTRKPRN